MYCTLFLKRYRVPYVLTYSICFRNDRKISSRIEAATNSEEEDSAESDSEESGEVAVVGGPGPIQPITGPQADQQAVPRPR